MRRKVRLLGIGAAAVLGASALAIAPFANAAESPESIMAKCDASIFIEGKEQRFNALSGKRPMADTCDLVEVSFTSFDGPTERVTEIFRNCPPDSSAGTEVTATWSASVGQITGRYKFTTVGAGGSLFGALNGAWLKHTGTLDLKYEYTESIDTQVFELPVGKTLYVNFTPKMQSMKAVWKVHTAARNNPMGISSPEYNAEAQEEVIGPLVLTGGSIDGKVSPVYANC